MRSNEESPIDWEAFFVDGEIKLIDTPKHLKLQYGKATVRVEYLANGSDRPIEQEFALADLSQNGFVQLVQDYPVQTIHTQPMPIGEGQFMQPTGKAFKLTMATIGHWKGTTMDAEYLFWDNASYMKQLGLGQ